MTKVYQDETIGKIEFAYNGWTGRFNARINGIQATRVDKRMLRVETDAETGKTTLKIPVPDKQTVRNLLDIVGKLFG